MSLNNYTFVKNEEKYYDFIRCLRCDKDLKSGFVEQANITPEQQTRYMEKHKDEYYIALLDNEPVGFIGVVDNDVRLAVKKAFQRKGVASFMLKEISKIYKDFDVLVKEDNFASLQMFKKNGFVEIGTKTKDNHKLFILKKTKK